jgi:ATP-dependent Clp protease ATP-binding subunit ClpB
MTSNVGSQHLVAMTAANRGAVEDAVLAELRRTFRPEFLNRIDETVLFNPLGEAELAPIVRIQLARYDKLLADRGLRLRVTERALHAIAARGHDPAYGARPLKRAIQRLVIDPLATRILAGEFQHGDVVVVELPDGAAPDGDTPLTFRAEAPGASAGAAA